MKNLKRVIVVLTVLVGIGGSLVAHPSVSKKEVSELKKRHNSHAKKSKIAKAKGVYWTKVFKARNGFKNVNPKRTISKSSYYQVEKYSRSSKSREANRGVRMNNRRKGNLDDRRNSCRRGDRDDRKKAKKSTRRN